MANAREDALSAQLRAAALSLKSDGDAVRGALEIAAALAAGASSSSSAAAITPPGGPGVERDGRREGDDRDERREGGDAAITPPGAIYAEDVRVAHRALLKRNQVDLNHETNLAALENSNLNARMDGARSTLSAQASGATAAPDRGDIRARHVKVTRQFSELALNLEKFCRELLCGVEETLLQASNAAKLAKGVQPHAFAAIKPSAPDNAKALAELGRKIEEAGKVCQAAFDNFNDARNSVDVLRRESERVSDDFARLADHHARALFKAEDASAETAKACFPVLSAGAVLADG